MAEQQNDVSFVGDDKILIHAIVPCHPNQRDWTPLSHLVLVRNSTYTCSVTCSFQIIHDSEASSTDCVIKLRW